MKNPEILQYVEIPHESGPATSLVERQVSILRERNIDLRKRLKSLLETASTNDDTFEKMRSLTSAIIDVRNIHDLEEIIKQELEEASVTGNIDGGEGPPKTPFAFSGKRKKDKKKEKEISTNSTGFKVVKESITEGKYHDYRNDDSLSAKQKIGRSMREVRDSLKNLEKVVGMNVRLKNELNVDSRSYWKIPIKL